MTMQGGYHHRLLRVDLTSGKFGVEPIDPAWEENFLGGRGLAGALLYRELPPSVEPLSPENKLIMATGPLVGTPAPGSGRFAVTTKSPLTGIYLESICGGSFGPRFKACGFDVMIIEGQSDHPVYLSITEDRVEIRDASHLWGTKTLDCQELIRHELHDPGVIVACIGPGGENRVPYAAIISERRAAGRGGAGAVMGAKNLKAIAVNGSRKTPIADPERFQRGMKQAVQDVRNDPRTRDQFPTVGSAGNVAVMNEIGVLPCRNWSRASVPEAERITGELLRRNYVIKDVACATPCPVKCSKMALVRTGELAGTMTEGPEYETIYALGSCCGVYDPEVVIAADALCDDFGLDTISAGVSVAFAMECFEKGIISAADYGMDLQFGDGRALLQLIPDIAYRRGLGALIAEGTRRMSQQLGRGSEAFAMHAKGMELGAYDPRGVRSMALVYACGPRGGCHHANGYPVGMELHGGFDRFSNEGKGELTKRARDRRILCDSAMICTFVSTGAKDSGIAEMLSGVIGRDIKVQEMFRIGDRIANVERLFNVREGIRRGDDVLPARLTDESVPDGSTQGQKVDLEPLVTDFYTVCGWDPGTGIPTREKILSLSLDRLLGER